MKKLKLLFITFFFITILSFLGMSLGVNAASASSTSLDTTLTDEQIVQRDLDTINLPRSMITSFPVTTQSVYGSKITWSSITEDVTNTSYVEETGWV